MARRARDMKRKTRKFTPRMKRCLRGVFGVVVLCLFGLVIYLFMINERDGDKYKKRVLAQQSYVSNVIPYRRGDILDKNENTIATSVRTYNLILDPVSINADIKYVEPTIKALKKAFGVEEDEIKKILKEQKQSQYVQMKEYKGLSNQEVSVFHDLEDEDKNIKGVWFEEEYQRKYPYKNAACDVIGFVTDNMGNWGIEEWYNEELSGSYGKESGYYDSELNLIQSVKPATNGNTIVSSIDINVQNIVQKHIKKFQKNVGAKNVAVVLMNPQNGEIYAMASEEPFDLNNPRDLTPFYSEEEIKGMSSKEQMEALSKIWRNYCISDTYEPGSTFKPITVAVSLDEGVATENSSYICDGVEKVGTWDVHCVVRSGHGELTLGKALMESCNDVMMQLARGIGKDSFYNYVHTFGMGRNTGIDLPGEGTGIVFEKDALNASELATSAFGQSQTVTMIQMAAAFSSVINGGNYYTPHVVSEIRNDSGAVLKTYDDLLVRKTITSSTSKTLREFLYKTVEEGTASPAQVKGYAIGGKTGTAEKQPRNQGNYLVSFIGFTPVEDPQVVCYVVIDEPNVEDQAHSTYATEFSSSLLEEVLPFLGVYPDKKANKSKKKSTKSDNTQTDPSATTGLSTTAEDGVEGSAGSGESNGTESTSEDGASGDTGTTSESGASGDGTSNDTTGVSGDGGSE